MADGQVIFEINGDNKGVKSSINDTTAALEKAGKKWDSAAKSSTDSIGDRFTSMFKKISAAAVATKVAHELLEWGKAAVQAASDLEEVQNVVDVTFGDGAAQIQSWADNARKQFGLTEVQAKRFTSTLGAMMKSAGMAGPEIVQMSTDLAGLAADMASFYNLDFDTAFQKIRSGISGETEPLKQLGINMSVANLQAYALQQGITKAFDKMSQSEQTMLRYQYLMQATADAQGDFARTSDGYANSVRLLETNLEQLKTTVGTAILPVINGIVGSINDMFDALDPENHKTTIDRFNEIDLDTETKIAEIEATAAEAQTLIGALEEISGAADVKTGLASFVDVLAGDLDGLGTALESAKTGDYAGTIKAIAGAMAVETGTSAETWETLLTTIADSLPGATTAAMSDDEKTAAFLQAAGDAAASLGGDYPELWQTFLGILGDDAGTALTALAEASEGVSTMEALASAAGKVNAGSAENWRGLLSALNGSGSLSGIFGDAGTAASSIETFATALSGVGADKANTWNELLTTLSEHAGELSELTGMDEGATREWLAGLAESANSLDPDKAEGWDELFSALVEGLPGLSNTEEGKAFLESIAGLYSGVGVSADEATSYLEALGFETDDIADKQTAWLAVCARLEKVIPGISSLINTNTGEVEGGTEALRAYVQNWEDLQKKTTLLQAISAKEGVLKTAFGDWESLKAEMEIRKAVADMRRRAFTDAGGQERIAEIEEEERNLITTHSDEKVALQELAESLEEADKAYEDAAKAFHAVDDQVQEATKALEEQKAAVEEMPGEIDAVAEATNRLAVSDEEAANSLTSFQSALKAVNDYYQTMRDETDRTVKQTIDGFGKIVTPVQKAREEVKDLTKQITDTNGKEINLKIADIENSIPTAQNMRLGLESQIEYMETYMDNLAKAKALGVNEDLLASLSSGSTEDADYLAALATATGPEIEALNDAYAKMQETREGFTDTLTAEKLTADEAFSGLVETLQSTLTELDMADGAQSAMYSTVEGIVNGIALAVPDLQTQVDAVLAEIARLDTVSGGHSRFRVGRFSLAYGADGSHAAGLDYVPFDGYLSVLHEGESILNAEEARIWRDYKEGGRSTRNSIDYGALSGAIWDNAPNMGGGNVYLNGQAVGRVINAQQADSLRSLERSGWQG